MTKAAKSSIILGLLCAIILDTAGQLLWKYAALGLPETVGLGQMLIAVLQRPYFLLVSIIFLCQLANWLILLKKVELSYAQPLTSLSYITVCAGSAIWLGEYIQPAKMFGIAAILIGVWLLGTPPSKEQDLAG